MAQETIQKDQVSIPELLPLLPVRDIVVFSYMILPLFVGREGSIQAVKQAMAEQDEDWTTLHRFWSCGHDSSCPDVREIQMIKDCNDCLQGKAQVFHSTFEDFQKQIINSVSDDLPVAAGEMRYYSDSESTSPLFGWIIFN